MYNLRQVGHKLKRDRDAEGGKKEEEEIGFEMSVHYGQSEIVLNSYSRAAAVSRLFGIRLED